MSEFVLEMKDVYKAFPGVVALNHVKLQLRPGTVHALMGENGAGKSTLMKCMFGIYSMDEGEIFIDGEKVEIHNPMDALNKGIAMVHQELQPIPARTIGENIYLGRYPLKKFGPISIVDHDKMYADAARVLKEVKMDFDPKTKVGELSVSQMQSVEIAKAVSANCRVLILDEPTSSLTQNEVEALFRIVEDLKSKGVAIVYISHKMDEILRISDEVTIMRDGQYIGTWDAKNLTTDFIITKMVGRELTNLYPPTENVPGDVVFEVEDFTSINPKSFRHCSFNVRKGEIVGISGLMGAGRTELAMSVFGKSYGVEISGETYIDGQRVHMNTVAEAIKHKLAYVTEDRKGNGLILSNTIKINTSLANLTDVSKGQVIDKDKEFAVAQDYREKLKIKCPTVEQNVGNLSGGNMQKVLLAKWMFANPDVLILDEPTRGIDVGAKYEIYCIMNQLVAEGKSVIMISSEMPEILGMCDRIYIMNEGKIVGELDAKDATQETIMSHIIKAG